MTSLRNGSSRFVRENLKLLAMFCTALVTGLSTVFLLLLAPRIYATVPPTSTATRTPTRPRPTDTSTAPPTHTPTSSPTPTIWVWLTDTPPPPLQQCHQREFPCLYVVESGDTFPSIARELYGNPDLSTIIRAANRNPDGTYARLIAGSIILLPPANQTPVPNYPSCSSAPSLPCLYQVDLPLFEIEWLARAFYGTSDPQFVDLILGANLDIGDVPQMFLEYGDVVVIPAPP